MQPEWERGGGEMPGMGFVWGLGRGEKEVVCWKKGWLDSGPLKTPLPTIREKEKKIGPFFSFPFFSLLKLRPVSVSISVSVSVSQARKFSFRQVIKMNFSLSFALFPIPFPSPKSPREGWGW